MTPVTTSAIIEPMEFYYEEAEGDLLILAADGGLNEQTAEQFVHEIESLIDSGLRKIIVDCAHLTYINSYGLTVLVRLHKRMAHHGGDVKIANVHHGLMQLLRVTHLAALFDIHEDVSRAKLAFRPPE